MKSPFSRFPKGKSQRIQEEFSEIGKQRKAHMPIGMCMRIIISMARAVFIGSLLSPVFV